MLKCSKTAAAIACQLFRDAQRDPLVKEHCPFLVKVQDNSLKCCKRHTSFRDILFVERTSAWTRWVLNMEQDTVVKTTTIQIFRRSDCRI